MIGMPCWSLALLKSFELLLLWNYKTYTLPCEYEVSIKENNNASKVEKWKFISKPKVKILTSWTSNFLYDFHVLCLLFWRNHGNYMIIVGIKLYIHTYISLCKGANSLYQLIYHVSKVMTVGRTVKRVFEGSILPRKQKYYSVCGPVIHACLGS